MQPPPGYDHPPNKVCRLQKALYGLKQSPLGEGFHYFTYFLVISWFQGSGSLAK